MKIKPWTIQIKVSDGDYWHTVDTFRSRTAGGAIAQFTRDINKHFPSCVAVRALEKTS